MKNFFKICEFISKKLLLLPKDALPDIIFFVSNPKFTLLRLI